MFDAVQIEYAFAYFFGKQIGARGGFYDADVFRAGQYGDLGDVLEKFAAHFKVRASRLQFAPEECEPGGAKVRLDTAIEALARMGGRWKGRQGESPEESHWMIIGDLVHCIAALLDHIEGKGAPNAYRK